MEEAHAGEGHGDAVPIRRLDHVVVADGAAGLDDVVHAGLAGALDVVAEGEERVGAHGDARLRGDPGLLLLGSEGLGLHLEHLLPLAVAQHVLPLVGGVDVDGVVAVGAADAVDELKAEHLGVLAQVPVVGLAAGQARAVDAALLARADADGLTVLDVAHRVGLRVLERDEGDHHVDLGLGGNLLVLGHHVGEQVGRDLVVVAALLEGDAEDVLGLHGSGHVGRVDLHDVVLAGLLGLEDLERLVGVGGGDDAVGHLALEVAGHVGVAGVGQGHPVAVGAQAVGAAGADVGAGDGGELAGLVDEVHLAVGLREGLAHGGAGGGDVLEGGGGGQAGGGLQLAHELPGVEGVEEVDVAGLAVEHGEGQVGAVPHENLRRLLVGVAAVLEFELVHGSPPW